MRHALLAFIFFLALAVVLTWPLGTRLSHVLADLGDSALNTFIIDWDCYALTHDPLHVFNAPIFAPDKYPLAYSENMLGIAAFLLPLHAIGAVATHNLGLLAGFATSALAAYVLAFFITRDAIASLVAGIFYGFTNFKFDHIVHLQIVWSAWLPLLLLATLLYWRTPDAKRAAFVGIAFAFNGLSNIYFLLMGGFAFAITVGFLAVTEPRQDKRFWSRLAIALTIAVLVLVPVLVPYAIVSHLYHFKHAPGEVTGGSAQLRNWLIASPFDWLYGRPDEGSASERHLFPGIVVILLGIAALLRRRPMEDSRPRLSPRPDSRGRLSSIGIFFVVVAAVVAFMPSTDVKILGIRLAFDNNAIPIFLAVACFLAAMIVDGSLRRWVVSSRFTAAEWTAAIWLALGFIGSLGMHAFLHRSLYRLVPWFGAIRVPARWAVVAEVGLAMWAAIGAAELLRRVRYRNAVGTLLIALTILEVIPHRFEWHEVPPVAPVYRWMRDARPGVALELPMSGHGEQALYLLASTAHHQPIMNGASGWDGPTHLRLNTKWAAGQLDDDFLQTIERAGCRVVIVHRGLLQDHRDEVNAFTGRLRYLFSFGSDDVYAVTSST